jgi:hypothetical protein
LPRFLVRIETLPVWLSPEARQVAAKGTSVAKERVAGEAAKCEPPVVSGTAFFASREPLGDLRNRFSFDGPSRPYLICPKADSRTTELSNPEVKLPTDTTAQRGVLR